MKLPSCFYTKAFWILVPILVISMGSGAAAINAQLNLNTQYDYVQDDRINSLTYDINEKITRISVNQILICDKLEVNCK